MRMARKARQKNVYSTYHILQTGTEGHLLFRDDVDRERFLEILSKAKRKFNFKLYGYCLQGNSYQLILFDNGGDISKIMKSINISYAIFRKADGALFRDRYKSEIIEDGRMLLDTSRNMHQMTGKEALENPWSSYCAYVKGAMDDRHLLDSDIVLKMLSGNEAEASYRYKLFMEEEPEDLICDDMVSRELYCPKEQQCISSLEEARERLGHLLEGEGIVFDELRRHKNKRNAWIKAFRQNSTLTLKELGILFGGLSESTVCKILNK